MNFIRRHFRLFFGLALGACFVAIMVSRLPAEVDAQNASLGPKISTIFVGGVTSTTATINYALNFPNGTCSTAADTVCTTDATCPDSGTCTRPTQVEVQIDYGKTKSYDQHYPVDNFAVKAISDSTLLTQLEPSTTYHYRVKVRAAGSDTTSEVSADRTFSTRSGDTAATPIVTIQRVECTNSTCAVTFTTATPSHVALGWDTAFHAPTAVTFCDPGSGYPHCSSETATTFVTASRQLTMTGLAANTRYHYRLLATDALGGFNMTGNATTDFEITTAGTSHDRTFTTGGCLDTDGVTSYPIGSCMPGGRYCDINGVPNTRCTNGCGATCEDKHTCNASGDCLPDPDLDQNSPYQCNKPSCFQNGAFLNPAPANCYASWPKCSANTILKVTKDRQCNLWLTCGTSVQIPATSGKSAENLCLSLSACNQLGEKGTCTHYLPPGQCDNDPLRFCANDTDCAAGGTCLLPNRTNPTQGLKDLTFSTPEQVKSVANLSGNVIAGLDWARAGSSAVIQGALPWQLMRQSGANVQIRNADFETNVPDPTPWIAIPSGKSPKNILTVEFEDRDNSINHVLHVSPITQLDLGTACVDDYAANPHNGDACDPSAADNPCDFAHDGVTTGRCQASAQETVNFSGAASEEFLANSSEYYYAEAKIKAASGNPIVRFELVFDGFTKNTVNQVVGAGVSVVNTYTDVTATDAWQKVTIGPIKGLSGMTRVAAVLADNTTRGDFLIDNVQVKPTLQVNTNPDYVAPSCRLYPKDNAPACDYTDLNGVAYRGWKGYCLENDSVTGNCLSWWPVDVIRGETSVFGTEKSAGYQDRQPLYMCAEAAGLNGRDQLGRALGSESPYVVSGEHNAWASVSEHEDGTTEASSCQGDGFPPFQPPDNITIGVCSTNGGHVTHAIGPSDPEYGLTEDMITAVLWDSSPSWAGLGPSWWFINNTDFQNSSADSPAEQGSASLNHYKIARRVLTTEPIHGHAEPGIYWIRWDDVCHDSSGGQQLNCVTGYMKFNIDTHVLEYYYLSENDQTGSETEAQNYRVYIHVKEQCNQIVKVVSDSGLNQAFAARVTSRQTIVPELGFKRITDVAPFSGLIGPADQSDPASWPRITIESKSGEFENGQTRSGPAYACKGNCATAVWRMNDARSQSLEGKPCTILSTAAVYGSIDSDIDGKADSVCTGGVMAASQKGAQLFDNQACLNIDPGTGEGICAGTNQCVTPFPDTCTAAKDTQGAGATASEARQDAYLGCLTKSTAGSCSQRVDGRTIPCYRAQDCSVLRAGFCIGGRLGSPQVACSGRCNGAGENVTFGSTQATGYKENTNGLYCTQVQYGNCVATGTPVYQCSVSKTACDPRGFPSCTHSQGTCEKVTPYSCTNPAGTSCTRARTNSPECPYPGEVTAPETCGRDGVTCLCYSTGQCVVPAASAGFTNAGVQAKVCTSSADCHYNADLSADASRYFAQEKIKRLFAQSYGIWTWNGNEYQPQAGADPSALPGASDFVGWAPPTTMCPVQEVPIPGACTAQVMACTAEKPITGDRKANRILAEQNVRAKCLAAIACDGKSKTCPSGTAVKYDDFNGTCNVFGDGTVQCVGRCTTSGSYTLAANQSTNLPPNLVAKRPTTVPEDYCAIPPQITNPAFTTGGAMTAVLSSGGGSIGIKFNTSADPEQLPLQSISIDWGDGLSDLVDFPYAPRSDPTKPHIYSHVYTYNNADSDNCDPTTGICTYHIKIQVTDNWGWCNDAAIRWCSNHPSVSCTTDTQCGAGGTCRARTTKCATATDTVHWYDTGLQVVLEP